VINFWHRNKNRQFFVDIFVPGHTGFDFSHFCSKNWLLEPILRSRVITPAL
jgi:hypothetical protein